ncbi:hypothetical protein LAB1_15500 [Roseibium sp. LAB1]
MSLGGVAWREEGAAYQIGFGKLFPFEFRVIWLSKAPIFNMIEIIPKKQHMKPAINAAEQIKTTDWISRG